MNINITIVTEGADAVEQLHKACNQILNGYRVDDPAVVIEPSATTEPSHPPIPPNAQGTPLEEKKHVDGATEQGGSTETTLSANAGVELDDDQLPWDKRIHTGKKTKNTDGCWKNMKIPKEYKGDSDAWHAYILEVKAELRAVNYDKPGETLHENPGESENPDPNNEFNPPAGQQKEGGDPVTFDDVITFLATITDHSIVLDVCEAIEIVNVFELETKPELIPDFYSRVNALVNLDE